MSVVPYDWRGGIEAAAGALDEAFEKIRSASPDTPLSVVGHGLGALGVLALVGADAGWADRLKGGRIVLVAPPLGGSEAILQLALGKGQLFRLLTRLDASRFAGAALRLSTWR